MAREYPSTIAAPIENEIVIKKSRFIAHVAPAASPDAADEVIAGIKKQHWDARHNCVAMVTGLLGDQARSSDDGEPSGTAGVPMLEVLRRHELTDLVAVVTRYFGGVKLGAGGLIRAYSSAVSEALDRAVLLRRESLTRVTLEVAHADAGRIENVMREWAAQHGARFGDPTYGGTVAFELWVPAEQLELLRADVAATSAGVIVPVEGEQRIIDVR
ncbi:YigZ family protein [Paramicrobacterium agarici]|uniref:YigZ family protein n=1 Tax=Paramicrobacterium agarici TaxID=630514 RepID=UPI00114E93CD|nr:YigZ family protein [Microbacterium agarici]TQO23063.1 putative YigZ family protein [Microbacterium agarici]